MFRTLPATLCAALLLAVSSAASAQDANEGSGTVIVQTGSGRSIDAVVQSIRALIPDRAPRTLKEVAIAAKIFDAWTKESASVRERQAVHRQKCAETLRRANRDTIVSLASQCLRSELLQEINLQRKHQQYIEAIPLGDPALRDAALKNFTELLKAESAIIDAIDAGLFEQIDGLKEAKRNLHAQYRLPLQLALTRLRMDRERTWIVFFAGRIDVWKEHANEQAGTELLKSALCLESATSTIASGLASSDAVAAEAALSTTMTQLSDCRKSLGMSLHYAGKES